MAKILVTLGIIIAFFFLFGIIVIAAQDAGKATPGVIGAIFAFGAIAAIRAVWKKKDNSNNNHHLDKS